MTDRTILRLRGVALFAVAAALAVPAYSSGPQGSQDPDDLPAKPAHTAQVRVSPSSPGIVFITTTPDLTASLRVAQGIITRVSLPEDPKSVFCGDLFDAASNAGTFVIDKNGTDVFIKPLAKQGSSNLFVKTEKTTYNFDLTVVPSAEAYRVVNVNLPQWEDQIRERHRRDLEAERRKLQADMLTQLDAKRAELEQASADQLEAERKKMRQEVDVRAGEIAAARLSDGIMQGLNGIPLLEKKKVFEQVTVDVDPVAYTFEGKLFVKYRLTNANPDELSYAARLTLESAQKDRGRVIDATAFTSRGDSLVPAGEATQGVLMFERPSLQKGDRLVLTIRAEGREEGREAFVKLRLLEQT